MARAMGCSDADSAVPARRSSSSRVRPTGSTPTTAMRPLVMVPVLSRTMTSSPRARSSTSAPEMTTPNCEPRSVPTSRAVGVASPSAHGHAMISTDTAAVAAKTRGSPANSQPARVSADSTSTPGTNTDEMRSASACTGALPVWASSTRRPSWASWVSVPTRVARTTRRPFALIVAPTTASPGPFSTGTDSPVIIDSSTADAPETTTPSVATFSPGRTTNSSPTTSAVMGSRRSTPPRSTATSDAPSVSRARRASEL